ncbi:MAG: oligosaccharide flippase family protein [Actinomycetia bacterium]|nr:oligosaccharide flippase family protein [Actinomycetes bacterium]
MPSAPSQGLAARVRDGIGALVGGGQGRDSVVTAFGFVSVFGLSIINGPLLARSLGTEGRGNLAAVVATTQLIGWLLEFGMPRATAYLARDAPWRALIMGTWFVVLVAALPIVVVLSLLVPWFLGSGDTSTIPWAYGFLAASLLVSPSLATHDWLRGLGRNVAFNIARAVPFVLTTLGYVAFALLGQLTLTTALAITLAANLIGWGGSLIWFRALPGRGFDQGVLRRQWAYGYRAAVGSLSYLVAYRFDQVLLVGLVSRQDLGIYVVAAMGATVSLPLSQGISQALLPHVRDENDPTAQRQRVRDAQRWSAIVSFGSVAMVALAAPFVIPFAFGSDFSAAVVPLWLLLPGQLANDQAQVLSGALDAHGFPGASSRAQFVAAVSTVVGLTAATPIWGIEGAAVVTSVSYGLYLLVVWILYRRITNRPSSTPEPTLAVR